MDKSRLLEVFTPSAFDVVKVLLTAVVIFLVTKVQLLSDRLSALLIALPLTSIVAMLWMYHDRAVTDVGLRTEKIGAHAYYTFWFVLPTLPMFLGIPWLLGKGWKFYPALGVNLAVTVGLFWGLVLVLRRLTSIELMP